MKAVDYAQGFDLVAFVKKRLGVALDARQSEILATPVKRGILNCSRQWGKSTITAALAVHRAWFEPDSLVLVLSPTSRQSGLFMDKVLAFTRRLNVKKRGDGHSEICQVFPNGSKIVGLPGVHEYIRGFSKVSLALIDEAARVPDDLFHAVQPMLAVSKGDMWLMSTPAGRQGFFWEEWNKPERWTRFAVPATECPRISAETLEEGRATLGERLFRQEYMCEFGDDDDALFSWEALQRALDPNEKGFDF
jgi:Terminase large subunit, T4likevirus-type, N-terminal